MRILLICSNGLSSAMLVEKMREAAKKLGSDINIIACGICDALQQLKHVDVILVSPQQRYMMDDLTRKAPDIMIKPITLMDYGTMNVDHILESVLHQRYGE